MQRVRIAPSNIKMLNSLLLLERPASSLSISNEHLNFELKLIGRRENCGLGVVKKGLSFGKDGL